MRYSGGVHGLAACLRELAEGDRARLGEMSAAAREWTRSNSWDDIGASTVEAFEEVVSR